MNIRHAAPVSRALWPQSARRNWCFLCKSRIRFIIYIPLPFEAKVLCRERVAPPRLVRAELATATVYRLRVKGLPWKPVWFASFHAAFRMRDQLVAVIGAVPKFTLNRAHQIVTAWYLP